MNRLYIAAILLLLIAAFLTLTNVHDVTTPIENNRRVNSLQLIRPITTKTKRSIRPINNCKLGNHIYSEWEQCYSYYYSGLMRQCVVCKEWQLETDLPRNK